MTTWDVSELRTHDRDNKDAYDTWMSCTHRRRHNALAVRILHYRAAETPSNPMCHRQGGSPSPCEGEDPVVTVNPRALPDDNPSGGEGREQEKGWLVPPRVRRGGGEPRERGILPKMKNTGVPLTILDILVLGKKV